MANTRNRRNRNRNRKNNNANETEAAQAVPQPAAANNNTNNNNTNNNNKNKQKPKGFEKPEKADIRKLLPGDNQMLEQMVIDFLKSEKPSQELFGLDNVQRKKIHFYARDHGLKTRSRSINGERILTLTRSETVQQHVRLESVKLDVCEQLNDVLEKALCELGNNVLLPLQHPRRQRATQGGCLVGNARIPPYPRNISHALSTERRQLPIFEKRGQILDLLNVSQVLIVNGATGSGKSTQLPQYLLEQAAGRKRPIRIIVSQPRRIAAITLSARIAEERGEMLGDTVGYIIRMESKHSNRTSLALTTSGCLLRSLAINRSEILSNTTHLIIDEVHDRDLNTDFLLLAIKQELVHNKSLKLILMSATMDLKALSKYFNNAPVIDVEGRGFNVRVFPLEDILNATGYMTPKMQRLLDESENQNEHLTLNENLMMENLNLNENLSLQHEKQQLLEAYLQAHNRSEQDIDHSLIVSLLQVLLLMGQKGAVIVYLPGYQDMTRLMDHLQDTLPRGQVKILLLHSQVDGQQQREVFREFHDVQLKIVLSTNIGQTSITIADLLYVIDTGRSKMKTYDPETGASQLACTWISQSDAQQRTGRAGRRKDGICYRLYSSQQFNNFSRFVIPEMMRNTLDEICLMAKIAAPQQLIEQFLSQALDPPQPAAIAQACAKLKLLNVLHDKDESVTDLGHILAELPLDVQLGKCLVYGIYYCCLGSLTIITAFYSVRDPFVLPIDRATRNEQRKGRDLLNMDCYSDSLAILQLYYEFISISGKRNRDLNRYCEDNLLCRKSMDMFVSAVQTLRVSVRRIFKISDLNYVTKYDDDMNMVRLALTAGLYPKFAYIDRTKAKKPRLIAESDPTLQLSRNSSMTMFTFARKQLKSNWLLYVEKTRSADHVSHIEHATLVSTLMVAIQCGKVVKMVAIDPDIDETIDMDAIEQEQEDDDDDGGKSAFCIDTWMRIILDTELGNKLILLRSHIEQEFNEIVASRIVLETSCPTVDYIQQMLDLNTDSSGLAATDIMFN